MDSSEAPMLPLSADQAPAETLRNEFPEALSFDAQMSLDPRAYMRYVGAMSTKINDKNLLFLSVVDKVKGNDPDIARTVGVISGGFGIAEGTQEVLSVRVPAFLFTFGSLLYNNADIKTYVPSFLTLRGQELGEGRPDLVGKSLLIHCAQFCMVLKEVGAFQAEHGVDSKVLSMIGPVVTTTRKLTAGSVAQYTLISDVKKWARYMATLTEVDVSDTTAEGLRDKDVTILD